MNGKFPSITETKLRVYNKTLDPNLWDDKTLKPEVKEALLKVAEDFYNSTELKAEIQNILFLGSSANYNWTPTSDIDVHIVIDIAEERINEEYARKFMDGLTFKWNTEHDIEVKGHPVEVYLQDVREPNSTPQQARPGAAMYALYDDKWLLEPNPQNIKLDSDKIVKKFQLIKKKIEILIQTENIEKLKDLMKAIRNYRDAGLAKGGEFSVENIVFKALRHNGDLKKMKDTINTIYDRKLSLPEEGHVLAYKKTKQLEENISPFNVIGTIDKYLHITAKKHGKGDVVPTHVGLRYSNSTDPSKGGADWRYRSDINSVIWQQMPTDDQKEEVLYYLRKHFGVKNPKYVDYNQLSFKKQQAYHFVKEAMEKPFLIVGVITDDLSVKSAIDYTGSSTDHVKMTSTWGVLKDVRWRYKSKTNTIYWMPHESEPTTNQREEVIAHLRSKYNVIDPKESTNPDKYFFDSHSIDEFINKFVENYNSGLFIDKKL